MHRNLSILHWVAMKQKWIATIVFWILFVLSLGLNEQYQWIGSAWLALSWLVVVAASVYFLTHSSHRSADDQTSNRRYPRWFTRFAYDQDKRSAQTNDGVKKGRQH